MLKLLTLENNKYSDKLRGDSLLEDLIFDENHDFLNHCDMIQENIELVTTENSEIYKRQNRDVYKMFHENDDTKIYKE